MAEFADIGYEESFRVTLSFCEEDYKLLLGVAQEKEKSIKELLLDIMHYQVLANARCQDTYEKRVSEEQEKLFKKEKTIELDINDQHLTERDVKIAKLLFMIMQTHEEYRKETEKTPSD